MANLRNEFQKFMEDYGYFVLLIRSNRETRCSCWNDKTLEARRDCPLCFGRGYLSRVEKHICRTVILNIPESLARSARDTEYGQLSAPSRAFYFKYDVLPRERDLVVLCDFDKRGLPKLDRYQVYELNTVELERGDLGRVEYIKGFSAFEPVDADITVANIRKDGIDLIFDVGIRR